jgi:hypothetical protein
MAIDGNDISCDHFGCREVATFTGELSGVDIRTRYHMLGWQICERRLSGSSEISGE